MHAQWLKALRDDSAAGARVRLRSHAATGASAAYCVVPLEGLENMLCIRDKAYRTMAQLRLGTFQPAAAGTGYRCLPGCDTDLRMYPLHGLHCKLTRRSECNDRHNAAVQVIADIVNMIGGVARTEPQSFVFDDGRRPDLRVVLGGRTMLIDVTIQDPCAPSVVNSSQAREGVIKRADKMKHDKYAQQCHEFGVEFHPMAFEISGHYGGRVKHVFHEIAAYAARMDNGFSYAYVRQLLSLAVGAAIQQGNHEALTACTNRVREWERLGCPLAYRA